jgi:hypothetical protein
MGQGLADGALQPDGRIQPESVMDVKHVADTIVHIAGLPNDVQVLQTTIMYVFQYARVHDHAEVHAGHCKLLLLAEGKKCMNGCPRQSGPKACYILDASNNTVSIM